VVLEPQQATQPRPASPIWRRLLGLALLAGAVAYLWYTLRGEVDAMKVALARISALNLVAATLCALAMCYLKAIYHRTLLHRISGRSEHLDAVVPAYTQAQVVRYLPGKVWGLLHQANQLSNLFTPQEVMLANLLQMLATNLMAVGFIVSIIATVISGNAWWLAGVPSTLAAMEYLHRNPMLERWIVRMAIVLSRGRFGTRSLAETPIAPIRWKATSLLAAEWVAFYAMWLFAADGWMPIESIIAVGTWYAAASLLAILAIAVPAGLVVREAIFVSLGGLAAYPQGMLLVLAAAMRIIMTLGELACIPVAMLVRALRRRNRPGRP